MKGSARQEQQRQVLHTFWQSEKLCADRQGKADEIRKPAASANARTYQTAKEEATKIINTVHSEQDKVRVELRNANLLNLTHYSHPKIAQGSNVDNPRVQLESSSISVRSESALLLVKIGLLRKRRADAERRRPTATCMTIVGLPTIIVVTAISVLVFQQPVRGLVSMVAAIATQRIGVAFQVVATAVATPQHITYTSTPLTLDDVSGEKALKSGDVVEVKGVLFRVTTRQNNTCGGYAFELTVDNTSSNPITADFEVIGTQSIWGGTPPRNDCYLNTIERQSIAVAAQQVVVYGFRDLASTGPTILSVTIDGQTVIWQLR